MHMAYYNILGGSSLMNYAYVIVMNCR